MAYFVRYGQPVPDRCDSLFGDGNERDRVLVCMRVCVVVILAPAQERKGDCISLEPLQCSLQKRASEECAVEIFCKNIRQAE